MILFLFQFLHSPEQQGYHPPSPPVAAGAVATASRLSRFHVTSPGRVILWIQEAIMAYLL